VLHFHSRAGTAEDEMTHTNAKSGIRPAFRLDLHQMSCATGHMANESLIDMTASRIDAKR
jgi:hypothetical protein